jgi:hypothetical protein
MGGIIGPLGLIVTTAESVFGGHYRPTAWDAPAQTILTVPATSQPGASPLIDGTTIADLGNLPGTSPAVEKPAQAYVFDAILRADHSQRLRITQHPVQTGANITDHAYREQPRVVLDIGMSDAMESYDPDSWSSATSKSVSAYQTILDLQKNRTLLSLKTRIDTYDNVLIETIQVPDNYKTMHGLRMTVTFLQNFFATVTSVSSSVVFGQDLSARPQTTASTAIGQLQTAAPTQALVSQHNIASTLKNQIPAALTLAKVPGAGLWSSLNINALKNLVT